jgi:hypothetical protein
MNRNLSILLCLFFAACKPAYETYKETYSKTFSAPSGSIPDYSNLNYWAAHPWKKDPSDSVSLPLKNETIDSSADVFFLHPTTLTSKKLQGVVWNADINDAELNAKTDYTSILYQASVFNKSCRVFAPRYRQAHIYSFYTLGTEASKNALDLAYSDIKTAFEYYLEHDNHGRPIILAGHSQGTYHAERLLKEYFENKPLQKQLVCAYIIGMVTPKTYFNNIYPCADSASTGCFVTWRTFREGYLTDFVKKENGSSWVVNPLNWKMDEAKVSRNENLGAVLFNYNKILNHTNGARITNGILWINKPKFPFSFLSARKNYHVGDINLFYMNVRTNIDVRIRAFENKTD